MIQQAKNTNLPFEIQAMETPFCFWMESILLGHIYHMSDCQLKITGHVIQNSQ
jgi:hypothetical protein